MAVASFLDMAFSPIAGSSVSFGRTRRTTRACAFQAFSPIAGSIVSFGRTRRTTRACAFQEKCNTEVEKYHEKLGLIDKSRTCNKNVVTIPDTQPSQHNRLPPLVSALKDSSEQNVASFHFPGHNRGKAAPSSLSVLIGRRPFLHDLPELPELDNLFAPEGPILDAQKQAAKLFGAEETWFLVGGSTCGVQATIMATCSPGETIILPRNCHTSAISAMILSGALPKYITPEYDFDWDIAGGITPSQVKLAIKELEREGRRASAVFVTSPTYHGVCSNVGEISQLCHSQNIPVIVDEAHGAHLGFHRDLPPSALHQGADLAVQSTHKVLCSLTQSSMLHMSGKLVDREKICRCLQTLQSTSPSYLLLASLDAARAQISENPETVFDKAVELAVEAKRLIRQLPRISVLEAPRFSNFLSFDPLRITVGVWQLGLSGFEADDILYDGYGVVSELTSTRSVTFAINLGSSREDILRLVSGLKHLSETYNRKQREDDVGKLDSIWPFAPSESTSMRLSPRDAFFTSKRKVSFKESLGEICGELVCPYPPGIPLLIPGEVITGKALSYLMEMRSRGAFISGAADSSLSSIVVCNA